MFDLFSWQHIVLLLVVALVVVGPKDLPRLMNMMGRWVGKARDMANEFRRSFDDMARQAELDELRREIDDLKKSNPVSSIGDAMNEVRTELERPVEAPDAAAEPAAETVTEPPPGVDAPSTHAATPAESSPGKTGRDDTASPVPGAVSPG